MSPAPGKPLYRFESSAEQGRQFFGALEVATLKAVAAAWGVSLEGISLAMAAQWVENTVVGAACGIMDQAAIVLGRENCLLPLVCQPCQPFSPISLPPGAQHLGHRLDGPPFSHRDRL